MHRMCSVAGCTSKKACLEQGLATLSSDTLHLVVNASNAILLFVIHGLKLTQVKQTTLRRSLVIYTVFRL